MGSAAFVEFGGIVLDPTIDGGMIHLQPPFQHHFLEIAVAERVAQVLAHAQQNDIGLEMTPFERMLLCHDGSSCVLFLPL
jgi:hypothetical protein